MITRDVASSEELRAATGQYTKGLTVAREKVETVFSASAGVIQFLAAGASVVSALRSIGLNPVEEGPRRRLWKRGEFCISFAHGFCATKLYGVDIRPRSVRLYAPSAYGFTDSMR